MDLGNKLYTLRKQKGISQETAANEIGVSRQTISKWETNSSYPEFDKLVLISKLYDISLDELAGITNINNKEINYIPIKTHYEYISKRKIGNIPLIHINIGRGFYKAKGIIAIGNIAKGLLSIGLLSIGLISLGPIAIGLLSALGGLCIAGVSIGGLSVGIVAIDGFALGIFAIGGFAMGIYSIGGAALASKIAAGGYANAPVAIMQDTENIKTLILNKLPNTPNFLINLFSSINIK